MDWSRADLHIENLVPGVIVFIELYLAFPILQQHLEAFQPYLAGAGFVAGSYGVGVLVSMMSRFLLDQWSERWFRAPVFMRLAHEGIADLVERYTVMDPHFLEEVDDEIGRLNAMKLARIGLVRQPTTTAQWNVVYRSAIRASQSPEVDRRRAQGRLVRGLFLPVLLAAAMILPQALPEWDPLVLCALLVFIMLSIGYLMVWIYAYSEYNVFAEAHDIVRHAGR